MDNRFQEYENRMTQMAEDDKLRELYYEKINQEIKNLES